jgi:hypothetical protein
MVATSNAPAHLTTTFTPRFGPIVSSMGFNGSAVADPPTALPAGPYYDPGSYGSELHTPGLIQRDYMSSGPVSGPSYSWYAPSGNLLFGENRNVALPNPGFPSCWLHAPSPSAIPYQGSSVGSSQPPFASVALRAPPDAEQVPALSQTIGGYETVKTNQSDSNSRFYVGELDHQSDSHFCQCPMPASMSDPACQAARP